MKKLLAAWLCLAVVACAASRKQAMTEAPAQAGGAPSQAMPGDAHAEIEQLSQQIEQQRVQLNLPAPQAAEPMSAHTSVQAPVAPPHTQDATCHPAPSQTCSDSCTLSDSICGNADKICKLADGMPGDDWAAGKCSTAKQTCGDAHKRCCDCT